LAGALALISAASGTADCRTLDELLKLPIEQLLRLEITSRRCPQMNAAWPSSPSDLRAVEHCDGT